MLSSETREVNWVTPLPSRSSESHVRDKYIHKSERYGFVSLHWMGSLEVIFVLNLEN